MLKYATTLKMKSIGKFVEKDLEQLCEWSYTVGKCCSISTILYNYCVVEQRGAEISHPNEIVNAESYTDFAHKIQQLDLSEFLKGMS